jgi:hypothetical protein
MTVFSDYVRRLHNHQVRGSSVDKSTGVSASDAKFVTWDPYERSLPPAPRALAGSGTPFKPNAAQRLFVKIAACTPHTIPAIAKHMGVAVGTLRRHFLQEVKIGRAIRAYWNLVKRGKAPECRAMNPFELKEIPNVPRLRRSRSRRHLPVYRQKGEIRPEDFARFGKWKRRLEVWDEESDDEG